MFAHRGGRAEAATLVAARDAVTLLLDGLDEMDAAVRPVALRALGDAPFRVAVFTRSQEMVQVASEAWLAGGPGMHLHEVSAADAAAYLQRTRAGPPPSGWAGLLNGLREHSDGVLARGLCTPLALTLLRDTYQPGDDVTGGTSPTGHPSPPHPGHRPRGRACGRCRGRSSVRAGTRPRGWAGVRSRRRAHFPPDLAGHPGLASITTFRPSHPSGSCLSSTTRGNAMCCAPSVRFTNPGTRSCRTAWPATPLTPPAGSGHLPDHPHGQSPPPPAQPHSGHDKTGRPPPIGPGNSATIESSNSRTQLRKTQAHLIRSSSTTVPARAPNTLRGYRSDRSEFILGHVTGLAVHTIQSTHEVAVTQAPVDDDRVVASRQMSTHEPERVVMELTWIFSVVYLLCALAT